MKIPELLRDAYVEGASLGPTREYKERLGWDPFPPPYIELSTNTRMFRYVWRRMHIAHGPPDPRGLQPLNVRLRDLQMLRRFVQTARDLAKYPAFNHRSALTTSFTSLSGHIRTEPDFPPKHEQQSVAIQLRQLHGSDEAAFNNVHGLLMQSANHAQDSDRKLRTEVLKRWGKIRREVLKLSLRDRLEGVSLAIDYDLERVPVWKLEGPSPEEMIKLFFYGDRIHWGNQREEFERLMAEPNQANAYEYEYLIASAEAGYFYMGYARLIEQLVPAARV